MLNYAKNSHFEVSPEAVKFEMTQQKIHENFQNTINKIPAQSLKIERIFLFVKSNKKKKCM